MGYCVHGDILYVIFCNGIFSYEMHCPVTLLGPAFFQDQNFSISGNLFKHQLAVCMLSKHLHSYVSYYLGWLEACKFIQLSLSSLSSFFNSVCVIGIVVESTFLQLFDRPIASGCFNLTTMISPSFLLSC